MMESDRKHETYNEEIEKIDVRVRPEIENHGKAAYEYGVLVQKHLFFLYGGSLVVIPPLLQASPEFSVTESLNSAVYIFSAIILLNICTYIVHLNWNFNLSSSQNDRGVQYWLALERVWGVSEETKQTLIDLRKKEVALKRKIVWTFYLPHFFWNLFTSCLWDQRCAHDPCCVE
jgi:hypothetical protein